MSGQVAIVGSGPSGCYTAGAILKAHPNCRVVVFEKLPMPFGLIRYGVAADHQGTKAVANQFDRLFDNPSIRFAGGLEIGRDLTLDELLDAFDVVVWAGGLSRDRRLNIPGEDLPGVYGSGELSRAWNAHPLQEWAHIRIGRQVCIVGAGNVGVDLARLLAKSEAELTDSDLDDVFVATVPEPVASITFLYRGGPADAKWDTAMIRELAAMNSVAFTLDARARTELTSAAEAGHSASDAILNKSNTSTPDARVGIEFVFGVVAAGLHGTDRVQGVAFADADGERTVECDTVLTAIGFEPDPLELDHPRLFRAGWVSTGARGSIPTFRTAAKNLAGQISVLLAEASARQESSKISSVLANAVPFAQWRAIDRYEHDRAPIDRCRRKVRSIDRAREIIQDHAREEVA